MTTPPKRPRGRPRKGEGPPKKTRPNIPLRVAKRKSTATKLLGRTTSFDGRIYKTIVELTAQGLEYEEIADIIGVSVATIKKWREKNPNLKKDIDHARSFADDLVEHSLFKVAVGYSHPEEKVFLSKHGDIVTHDTTKHYPPDVAACKFWLTNRRADAWTNKDKVETEGNVTVSLAYDPNQRLVRDNNNGTGSKATSGTATSGTNDTEASGNE